MLNYKADATPFYNSLHVAPIRCSGGKACSVSNPDPNLAAAQVTQRDCLNGITCQSIALFDSLCFRLGC